MMDPILGWLLDALLGVVAFLALTPFIFKLLIWWLA